MRLSCMIAKSKFRDILLKVLLHANQPSTRISSLIFNLINFRLVWANNFLIANVTMQ